MLIVTGNGRLTREPALRHTDSGKAVANISVASDQRRRDDGPVYIDLVLWEGAAEAAAKHLVKGQAISFTGRLTTRLYDNRDGEKRMAVEVTNVDTEWGAKPVGDRGDS